MNKLKERIQFAICICDSMFPNDSTTSALYAYQNVLNWINEENKTGCRHAWNLGSNKCQKCGELWVDIDEKET